MSEVSENLDGSAIKKEETVVTNDGPQFVLENEKMLKSYDLKSKY